MTHDHAPPTDPTAAIAEALDQIGRAIETLLGSNRHETAWSRCLDGLIGHYESLRLLENGRANRAKEEGR